LNYTPTEEPLLPEEGGILQKFEEELEINDFPQQVTSHQWHFPANKELHS
jgi:hypothetical protein